MTIHSRGSTYYALYSLNDHKKTVTDEIYTAKWARNAIITINNCQNNKNKILNMQCETHNSHTVCITAVCTYAIITSRNVRMYIWNLVKK